MNNQQKLEILERLPKGDYNAIVSIILHKENQATTTAEFLSLISNQIYIQPSGATLQECFNRLVEAFDGNTDQMREFFSHDGVSRRAYRLDLYCEFTASMNDWGNIQRVVCLGAGEEHADEIDWESAAEIDWEEVAEEFKDNYSDAAIAWIEESDGSVESATPIYDLSFYDDLVASLTAQQAA